MGILISLFVLFLAVIVLVLIHICIVSRTLGGQGEGMVFMVDTRRRLGGRSMTRGEIEKLPSFHFTLPGKTSSLAGADCAVCLENFRAGEKCRLLPSCNHSFHAECVDAWLLRSSVCPVCRTGANLRKDGFFPDKILTQSRSLPVQTTSSGENEVAIQIREGVNMDGNSSHHRS